MIALGRKPSVIHNQSLMDGINAGRQTLPLARFDRTRCVQGLECLREYKTEWDEKARVFKKTPLHNWASHGADAWRYLSIAWREPQRPDEKPKPKPIGLSMNQLTYDQLHDLEDAPRRADRV